MKPNLFIVGAPKCGTTAWVHYLGTHPDIFFSAIKEPHHFSYDIPEKRWVKDRDDYLDLFKDSGSAPVVGEASPRYLYSDAAPGAIAEFNPAAKIIILVREQENFLPSIHNQAFYNGAETIADFETAWRSSRKRGPSNPNDKLLHYEELGWFSKYVERYFSLFPEEQILVIDFGDWTSDPRGTYLKILKFLDVPDDGRIEFPPVNEASQPRVGWLSTFLRRPPRALAAPFRLVRRLTGLDAGVVANTLVRLNSRRGYANPTSEELKAEIRRYYREDKQRLEPRISRPAQAATAVKRARTSA